jgi:acyl-CoA synthetase (AMP-forming)/AMP-acid ligase II
VNYLRTHPGALLEPRGAMVSPYPLFHMGAWTIALQQWQARDAVIFLKAATAPAICAAIERHRAARLNAVPAVWRRILDHLATPEGKGTDVTSVRFADTGTSATPLELLDAMAAGFPNAQVRVFYGSTEAGSVAGLQHADLRRKPGSVGPPGPACEVRISESGELLTRGPMTFDGYYGNEEATAAALVDGWYHTGDLAEADGEGYLSIIGRARDIIRTGGESVAPVEVEGVLRTHPAIADLAVVGIPDQQWGEIVCAAIIVKQGEEPPTVEELRAHCARRLASYKHPRRVEVVERIPRTASNNKVQRRLLIEQISVL